MKPCTLTVNGETVARNVEPRVHLADFLREDCLLTGTHLGCEHGICGACTVMKDGRPVRSCLTYAVSCEGAQVTSIEGFNHDPIMARLRAAFSAEHALQCGYCTPGMLITARDIVLRYGARGLGEAGIRHELSGNLCRCTGYVGIVRAIQRVLEEESRDPSAAGSTPESVQGPGLQRLSFGTIASIPLEDGSLAAYGEAAATTSSAAGGGRRIESTFSLSHSPEVVWSAIKENMPGVVACLPGAELSEVHEDGRVEGFFHIKLGPISARIAGEGRLALDETRRQGQVEGQGKDKSSNSHARGSISFEVSPGEAEGSRMAVALSFELTGTLAQFSRGSLIDDIVRSLIEQFRRNFDARLAGVEAPQANTLNPLRLLLMALGRRLRRLFKGDE